MKNSTTKVFFIDSARIPETDDATRSDVLASTDNRVECTLPTHLSSRSQRDLTWGIPNTLGCPHKMWIVLSTLSMIPSIECTCVQTRWNSSCQLSTLALTHVHLRTGNDNKKGEKTFDFNQQGKWQQANTAGSTRQNLKEKQYQWIT